MTTRSVASLVFLLVLVGCGPDSYQLILETEHGIRIEPHAHGPTDADPPHSEWFFREITVPEDLVVTGYEIQVHNAPLNILHHMALFRRDEHYFLCESFGNFEELITIAQNRATEKIEFAPPYGVVLLEGTPLSMEVMTHHADQPYGVGGVFDGVHFSVVLDVEPLARSDRDRSVVFFRLHLDDTPCEVPARHQAFAVPPQVEHFVRSGRGTSGEGPQAFVFPADGTILKMGANLWGGKGGEREIALINGEPVHEFVPEIMEPTDPRSWKIPIWQDANLRVDAGDTLTLEAIYSNPHEDPILDATGQLLVFFAPDET